VDDGNEMRSFSTGRPVWDVAYAKSGLHVLSGGESAAATLWDLSQGSALGTLEHPVGHIRSVALSPDGALAATGGDRLYPKIHLWDLGTGRVLHIYDGHTDAIIDLIFTPSGTHLLSCSDDGTMRLWQQPR
jgi:WD40 repeat protein